MLHYLKDQTPPQPSHCTVPHTVLLLKEGVCCRGVCYLCVCVQHFLGESWASCWAGDLWRAGVNSSQRLSQLCTCDAGGSEEEITHVIVMSINGFSGSDPLFRYSQRPGGTVGKTVGKQLHEIPQPGLGVGILVSSCDSCCSCLVNEWLWKM